MLTLLLLSPAVGELLSGSSPPLQFFNPVFLLLLVGLYGCGALLVREAVVWRQLNVVGLLLLGAAYGVLEEGLMCKSFFNPCWTDTGYLSVYGRAWGINWVWAFGLTVYHMVVSITVPIFLTEALYPLRAKEPWLRRRGWSIAGGSLTLVVLLGFLAFDNRQFHLIEMRAPLALARQLDAPGDPLARFISTQLTAKSKALVHKAAATEADSPDLHHAFQEEFNRLLPRPDLYSPGRFATVILPDSLKRQAAKPPRGDKLIQFNRALLELAYPASLAPRTVYPFRPGWKLTLACMLVILGLVRLAFTQTRPSQPGAPLRRPWLVGVGFTAAFVIVGFILPSLVEHGARVPVLVNGTLWCGIAVLVGYVLRRTNACEDAMWRRGLWALGVISPWVLIAVLLGVFVGMIGAKSFSGMVVVALLFGLGILRLGIKWRSRLNAMPPANEQAIQVGADAEN